MTTANIVVVGSSNTDLVVNLRRLPRPGETVLGGRFAVCAGGKGANQAVAAARAGACVNLVARVGNDDFGSQALAGLKAERVRVARVPRDRSAPSGVAMIWVDRNGQNSIAVAAGANERLEPAHLLDAEKLLADADVIVAQLEIPLRTVGALARFARRLGTPLILNPAPARRLPPALLRNVSVITPNEVEAGALTGIEVNTRQSVVAAAEKLLARGVGAVVMTLGRHGAFVACGELRRFIPGHRVSAKDSTGAGDVFSGTLAVAMGEGRPLLEAVEFANAAAAISVTRPGAQASAPKRAEIEVLHRARDVRCVRRTVRTR